MFHEPEQMDTTSPSLSLSRNMTSPHMVAVIDLLSESDGWLSEENGEGICTEQRRNVFHGKTHTAVRMNVSVARVLF